MKRNIPITIVPLIDPKSNASPPRWLLEFLSKNIPKAIEFSTIHIGPSIVVPKSAFEESRGQFVSEEVLRTLRKITVTHPNGRVLGVMAADAYARDLNFVFGQAELGGIYAVIYLSRLTIGVNSKGLAIRALKEAVHELGHTLGLKHCDNRACVMSFSNTIADTDAKGWKLCASCRERLLAFVSKLPPVGADGSWS